MSGTWSLSSEEIRDCAKLGVGGGGRGGSGRVGKEMKGWGARGSFLGQFRFVYGPLIAQAFTREKFLLNC